MAIQFAHIGLPKAKLSIIASLNIHTIAVKNSIKIHFFAAICYFSPIFFGSLTETLYFCGQVLFQPRSFRGEHYITNKNQ